MLFFSLRWGATGQFILMRLPAPSQCFVREVELRPGPWGQAPAAAPSDKVRRHIRLYGCDRHCGADPAGGPLHQRGATEAGWAGPAAGEAAYVGVRGGVIISEEAAPTEGVAPDWEASDSDPGSSKGVQAREGEGSAAAGVGTTAVAS
jgi:hypothetical protein